MGSNPEHESPGTVKKICPNCGEPFLRWRANALQTGAKFCSNRCANSGKNSHMWQENIKVEAVADRAYYTIHTWVRRNKVKPEKCTKCGKAGNSRQIQWANIDNTYRRVLENYIGLCVRCHVIFDAIKRGGVVNQYGFQKLRALTLLTTENPKDGDI